MKGRLKRAAGLALSFMMAFVLMLGTATRADAASAYSGLDTSKPCSLELSYHPDHGDRDGIAFRLYRVADMTDAVQLAFTDTWKDIPVTMHDLDAAGWARLANTLAGYIANDGTIRADYAMRTDAAGDLKFEAVPAGVYVLIGDSHSVEVTNRDGSVTTYHYEPRAEMVILPYLGTDGWVQDRTIEAVKYEVTDTTENPTIDRRVIKVWEDTGHRSERPASVEVALVKDDVVYEIVTLDAYNSWRHDWKGLPANATYRVVELTRPLNYRVTSYRSGMTFVLTNTYEEPEVPVVPTPTPPTPTPPDVPEPPVRPGDPTITVTVPDVPEDIPDTPTPLTPWVVVTQPDPTVDIDDPSTPLTPPDLEDLEDPGVPLEDLPQTGQLWWPVPILAGAAVLCFGVGVALIRKRDD